MRVAFVNHGRIQLPVDGRPFRGNSIGIWHFEVARRLPTDWDCTVFSPKGGRLHGRERTCDGVRFRDLPVSLEEKGQTALARLPRWLGPGGDPKRPLFASRLYYGAYALRIAREVRRRGVDVVHVTNFSQFVPPIARHNPSARIVLHMQCEWLTQLDPALIAPRLAACHAISGCSRFIADEVARSFPDQAAKCFALYNGVDLERFAASGARNKTRGPHLLFVGRLSPEKGVHVLLEAFLKLAASHPELSLELIGPDVSAPYEFIVALSDDPLVRGLARFYSGGRRAYADALRSMVPAELAGRVRFRPELPQAELADAFRRADVFVFPSTWQEPFGMPVAEAMAAGLPVVATRGGGLTELVEHERTGLLIERDDDATGLAAALERLIADPETRRAYGRAGRARAEAELSWDRIADELRKRLERSAP